MIQSRETPNTDWMDYARKYGALIALVLFSILNAIITPNFLTFSSMNNILSQVSTTVIVALGMTIVAASKGFDLSVGSVVALTGVVVGLCIPVMGVAAGIAAGLLVAAFVGAIAGALVAFLDITPIIVTIALMTLYRGIAQVISNGSVVNIVNKSFYFIGQGTVLGVRFQIILALAVVLFIAFLMQKTTYARKVTAIGSNENAAFLAGIKVQWVKMSVYIICAVLAAIAGVIEASKLECCDPLTFGNGWELDAIAATAIGGTSLTGGKARIAGTVIGAILMVLINVMINMNNIPYAYAQVFKAIIILLSIYLQREKKV